MLREAATLAFVLSLSIVGFSQDVDNVNLNRIYVDSNRSSSLIFEYLNSTLNEGKPVSEETVRCVEESLMSTGLFSDLKIFMEPETVDSVNLRIKPIYRSDVNKLKIASLNFDGVAGLNTRYIQTALRDAGYGAGNIFREGDIPRMKAEVRKAAFDQFFGNTRAKSKLEERMDALSVRILTEKSGTIHVHFIIRESNDNDPVGGCANTTSKM